METSAGEIIIKLYDDTPLHKANFLKLIEKEYNDIRDEIKTDDEHVLRFHLYADDNQIYITFDPNCEQSLSKAVKIMEAVVESIRWLVTI